MPLFPAGIASWLLAGAEAGGKAELSELLLEGVVVLRAGSRRFTMLWHPADSVVEAEPAMPVPLDIAVGVADPVAPARLSSFMHI